MGSASAPGKVLLTSASLGLPHADPLSTPADLHAEVKMFPGLHGGDSLGETVPGGRRVSAGISFS